MVEVSHPSMKRNKIEQPNTTKRQVYVVENAEDIVSANETAQEEQKQEVQNTPQEKVLPETPKSLFEDLVFLGCVSDIVEIHGHKFEISTLTHKENNNLMREIYKFGEQADLFLVRTLTLAQCIKSVDGIPLESIETKEKYESAYNKKLAILDSMQKSVIEKLYDFYSKLDDAAQKSVQDEDIKK